MSSRAVTAAAILVAWFAGLGMLVRREYFRPHIERLAEAALRVTPGAVFYAVLQGDRQVGFASSTIDTSSSIIEQREYLVADILAGRQLHRATARTNITMTRTLRVRSFDISVEADQGPLRVHGEVTGDSVLHLDLRIGAAGTPDTATVVLTGPLLLPTLVPLAVALEDRPSVGQTYTLPVFNATSLQTKDTRIEVRAESLFVVSDSSVFDSTTGIWNGVLPDTVRAWQLASESGSGIGGWVDAQGRLVASTQMGFRLQRRPYEVAFENWRKQSDTVAAAAAADVNDILETTAIGANQPLHADLSHLVVRLGGVPLRGFDLDGGRQKFRRDTLTVDRESARTLMSRRPVVADLQRNAFPELRPQPLLEVDDPAIKALAQRIRGSATERRVVAERINRWVHDSLRKETSLGIPSARQVLATRRGDCNEHTQLFVALARAAGVPARAVAGLVYLDGKFYYHAWPEIALGSWVAVDPTFGQFPADASHLRFVTGGLERQADLLRLVGGLTIDVMYAR